MDPTVIHAFFMIVTVFARPIVGDVYEPLFRTMQECREYIEANPSAIADAVEEARPFLGIPDGVPFKVAYGCRGKESI